MRVNIHFDNLGCFSSQQVNLWHPRRKGFLVVNCELALGLSVLIAQATYLLCDALPEACVRACTFQPDSNSVAPSTLKAAAFRRRDACVANHEANKRGGGDDGGCSAIIRRRSRWFLISPRWNPFDLASKLPNHFKWRQFVSHERVAGTCRCCELGGETAPLSWEGLAAM